MATVDDLLALRELPGVGDRTIERLLDLTRRREESLRTVLQALPGRLSDTYRLPPAAIARLRDGRDQHFARCRWIRDELGRAGGRIMLRGKAPFPGNLERYMPAPPLMLFALGQESLLRTPSIAVVSSRGIVDHTLQAIVAVSRAADAAGLAIVMGGMKSTHRLAAMTARAIGAKRIIVLDRGLFSAFAYDYHRDPFGCGDKPLAFDRTTTLALSPSRPEDHAAPNSGRRRDQIIAALGDLVFATSARPGGEIERICLTAIAQGKPVLLWGEGNRTLLQAGADAVDSAAVADGFKRFLASGERRTELARGPESPAARLRTGRTPRSPAA